MHRRFVYALSACSLGFALPSLGFSSLAAQQLSELTVSEANAQMDLWLRPYRRPDDNYTNGTQILAVLGGAPIWGKLLARSATACNVPHAADRACTSTDLQLAQDMYTPTSARSSAEPIVGERPYAGWLYASATGRVATATRSDAVTLELGVTGTPSLAEKVQTAWHSLIRYQRALGWSHQIPFTPGILVGYEHDAQPFGARIGGGQVLSIMPHVGATAGNVLTGATAGVDARFGYHVTTPWASGPGRPADHVAVYGLSAVRADWVGYDLFLDRPTSNPTEYVSKLPWVGQYEFGGGLRLWTWQVEYRAVTRTREYVTGRTVEPYSVISVSWRGVS